MSENNVNRVAAVTVTYNRTETLENTVEALLKQDYEFLESIIIVDNASNDFQRSKLEQIKSRSNKIHIIYLESNLGGAGGFHYGMKYAQENIDPDWYWIMDDDAYPRTNCLSNLVESTGQLDNIGFVAPIIFGVGFKEYQLYHHKMISSYKVNDIMAEKNIENMKDIMPVDADAFVGPMFSREAVAAVGLPDAGLFIYGDDTEYTYRVTRRFKGYIIKKAVIDHEDPPRQDNAVAPKAWWKEYYMFRNRYLFIDEFENNPAKKCIAYLALTLHLIRRIMAAALKNKYKKNRALRLNILFMCIVDGFRSKSGKTIDPKEYMSKVRE